MSADRLDVDSGDEHDDTPWCVGVLCGGRLDGREVRLREGALPAGFATQPPADWSTWLVGGPVTLPPPIRWRWTGRIDRHGRAVFVPEG